MTDTKVHISISKRSAIDCGDYNRSKRLLARMLSLYHHAFTALFFLLPRSLAATCAKADYTPCIAGGSTIPSASSTAGRALSSASTPSAPSTFPSTFLSTHIPSTTTLPSIPPAPSVPTYSASQAYSPPALVSSSPLAQPSTAPSNYGGGSSSSTANCPCCDPSFSAAEVATCWELVALGGAAAVDLTGGGGSGGSGSYDVLGSSSSFGMLVKRQSELRHINDNARREEQQFCCPIEDQCRFDDVGAPFCLVRSPLPPETDESYWAIGLIVWLPFVFGLPCEK